MNKQNSTIYIGIALLIIAIILFVLDKVSDSEFILLIASYGRFIGMFASALIGVGLMRKYRS
jgi:hypothetical protein